MLGTFNVGGEEIDEFTFRENFRFSPDWDIIPNKVIWYNIDWDKVDESWNIVTISDIMEEIKWRTREINPIDYL
jgi:hypothetical protein